MRVLLADDEELVLESMQRLLERLGHEVFTESNASLILARVRSVKPDVLLQDLRMPGLDHVKLIQEIRHDPVAAATPIVLFSASLNLREEAARLGVSCIEKPFHVDELLDILHRVCDEERERRKGPVVA